MAYDYEIAVSFEYNADRADDLSICGNALAIYGVDVDEGEVMRVRFIRVQLDGAGQLYGWDGGVVGDADPAEAMAEAVREQVKDARELNRRAWEGAHDTAYEVSEEMADATRDYFLDLAEAR